MIKTIKLFISCSIMFAVSISAYASGTGVVTGSDVNVRSSASTKSEVLGKLNTNATVSVNKVADDFFEVIHNDKTAYISKDFIKIISTNVTITANDVNIRKNADSSSDVIAQASKGETVTAMAIVGDFFEISYKGSTCYISAQYAQGDLSGHLPQKAAPKSTSTSSESSSQYIKVTSNNGLKLREGQSTDSNEILTLPSGYYAKVVQDHGDWVHVEIDGGTKGFLSSEFLSIHKGDTPENVKKSNSSKGAEIVNYGKKFVGTPYKWGGTNLKSGVDCSGFVYAVFRDFDIKLNRSSYEMPANGSKISKSELAQGDLVFFDTSGANNGKICHVGIYAGDGKFIHSSSGSKKGVIISSLNEGFYLKSYVTAARVL